MSHRDELGPGHDVERPVDAESGALALRRLAELEAPGWDEALLEAPLALVRREASRRERPWLQAAALGGLTLVMASLAWMAPPSAPLTLAVPSVLMRGLAILAQDLLPSLLLAGMAYVLTILALAGLGSQTACWRKRMKRQILLILALLVVGSGPALARDDDRVVFGGGVTVVPGDTVEGDVVSLGLGCASGVDLSLGSGVRGDVVSLLGPVRLYPGARVDGDVVAILGGVTLDPGARVEGDVVSLLGSGIQRAPGAVVGGDTVALLSSPLLGWLAFGVLCLLPFHPLAWAPDALLALLLLGGSRDRASRLADLVASRPDRCLLAGLLGVCLAPVLFGLLGVTVVGALLWPLLILAYAVAGAAGTAAVAGWIGNSLRGGVAESAFETRALVGLAILGTALAVLRGLPLAGLALGPMAIMVLRTLGVGALLLAWRRRGPAGMYD